MTIIQSRIVQSKKLRAELQPIGIVAPLSATYIRFAVLTTAVERDMKMQPSCVA